MVFSVLIKLKNKLTKSVLGKLLLQVYHYLIAIPLMWILSFYYHLIKDKIEKVDFYSIEETFDRMISERKSLSRFGDGEISWIYQDAKGYFGQENSEELSLMLQQVFNSQSEFVFIGIPNFFDSMEKYSKKRKRSRNAHLAKYYKRWMTLIKKRDNVIKNKYVDSLITRVYNGRENIEAKYLFDLWKKVWEDRHVVIIEGNQTRFGVGNDLLSNSKSVRRIIAPAENAFKYYDEILELSKKYIVNDALFLVALGPTATVLTHDIALLGGQAIDIGHLDIEYEWYLRKSLNKEPIPGKYVNEVGGASNSELSQKLLTKYNKEVIESIKN